MLLPVNFAVSPLMYHFIPGKKNALCTLDRAGQWVAITVSSPTDHGLGISLNGRAS